MWGRAPHRLQILSDFQSEKFLLATYSPSGSLWLQTSFFIRKFFFSAEVCQFSTHLGAHSRGVEGPRGIRVPRGISSPAHPSPTFAPLALQLYIRYLTGQFLRGLNVCRAEKSFANFSTQQNFLC